MSTSLPTIQCLWIGERLNGLARLSLTSFVANGHAVHLYTYHPVKNVPKGVTVMDANAVVPYQALFIKHGFGQGSIGPFSDWFRFNLLAQRGGLWADTDLICLKPLAGLTPIVISSEYTPAHNGTPQARHTNTCVLHFPPHDPLITYCLDTARTHIEHQTLSWSSMGPKLIEDALTQFPDYRQYVMPPEAFCPIDHWDVFRLIDRDHRWQPGPDTLAVHAWHELWRHSMANLETLPWLERLHYQLNPSRTLNLDARYPGSTLMGQWQRQYGV